MVSAVYRGWRFADDIQRRCGADAYLEKPLKLADLGRLLTACLTDNQPQNSSEQLSSLAKESLTKAAQAYRTGDLFGSVHHLEKAIQGAPFSANLHYRLGRLYEMLEENYRAIASLERAVELDYSYHHTLALARLYQKTSFRSKAFETWERCLRLCQDPKEADLIRGYLQRLLP